MDLALRVRCLPQIEADHDDDSILLASGGSGYLRIVAPDMAEGDYVEIQCEGAGPEDEGRIQWFFNNRVRMTCS